MLSSNYTNNINFTIKTLINKIGKITEALASSPLRGAPRACVVGLEGVRSYSYPSSGQEERVSVPLEAAWVLRSSGLEMHPPSWLDGLLVMISYTFTPVSFIHAMDAPRAMLACSASLWSLPSDWFQPFPLLSLHMHILFIFKYL